MAPNNGRSATDSFHELQERNAALEKQVEELKAERDRYLRTLHCWAKERVSEERVKNWMSEEKVEGSLMDFINEVKDQE